MRGLLICGSILTRQRKLTEHVGHRISLTEAPTLIDFVSCRAQTALLITGVIVFSTRWTARIGMTASLGWGAAIAIGCAQALAILPGISRSGSTVAMALAFGVAPLAAAEFSFLLGIIAITGAAVLMLPELGQADSGALVDIGIGGLAALVSGLLAIWLFVRMLDRSLFHYWAAYCWIVGGLFLAWTANG